MMGGRGHEWKDMDWKGTDLFCVAPHAIFERTDGSYSEADFSLT